MRNEVSRGDDAKRDKKCNKFSIGENKTFERVYLLAILVTGAGVESNVVIIKMNGRLLNP